MKIGLMIGSIRKGRQSDKPARVLERILEENGHEVLLLDLQELDLPIFDDGIEHEGKERLLEAYKEMDGLIIVSPEYNHSIPAPVKNAIDFARNKELLEKPLAVCSVSAGGWGGVRMTSELRAAWLGVGALALPLELPTPNVKEFEVENPPEMWLEKAHKFVEKFNYWLEKLS